MSLSPFIAGRRLVEIDGLMFLLRDDEGLDRHLIEHGEWEHDVDTYFRKTLEPGMVVLDIGANLGWYTMQAASMVGPKGLVVAFEPTDAAELVELHARLNGVSGRVIVNRQALGAVQGERDGLFAHSYPAGAIVSSYQREVASFTTLDQVVLGADLLKVDVDGYEAEVIKGGLAYLRKHRPRLVLEVGKNVEALEMNGYAEVLGVESIFASLAELDYDVRDSEGSELSLATCMERFDSPLIGSMNVFCSPRGRA